jgi:hypothetical protein
VETAPPTHPPPHRPVARKLWGDYQRLPQRHAEAVRPPRGDQQRGVGVLFRGLARRGFRFQSFAVVRAGRAVANDPIGSRSKKYSAVQQGVVRLAKRDFWNVQPG